MIDYSYILRLAKAYAIHAFKVCKQRGEDESALYWKEIVTRITEMKHKNSQKEVTT